MFGLEDILCEIPGECSNKQGLPPGFRFHPTDEELVTFFLASKVLNGSFGGVEIAEVDLNRCEPWELPDTAKIGEKEWYFFSLRDRKYPTGLRTNRATEAGYWKATGKDKEVYSASNGTQLIGMKKTLVFYKGRAPRGEKTKWVMHEYRLVGEFSSRRTCKDEWVICRMYHKAGTEKKGQLSKIHNYLLEQASSSYSTSILPPLLESPTPLLLEHESSTQTAIQHPNFIHHEIVPKSLLMDSGIMQDQLFSMGFQPSFSIPNSATTTSSNTLPSSSESILIKNTLFSHQVCTLKQPVASKIISVPRQGRQWKETTNFTYFQHQQADGNYISNNNNNMNMQWVQDKIQQQQQQQQQQRDHPLFFEMGCGFSAYADTGHEMSTSLAFSGDGFQSTLMDSYLREHGESGPLDA